MPELPEVQTIVSALAPRLTGRTVDRVHLNRDDVVFPPEADLGRILVGKSIRMVSRRGKRIVFELNDGCHFYIHLGMTGRLTVEPAAQPAVKHTHLEVGLSPGRGTSAGQECLRFSDPRRFGGIWWLGLDRDPGDGMGPEPLLQRSTQLARRLSTTSRAIKTALLDQSLVAGLGNIYVDESLFQAGIHPLTSANRLSPEQIQRLNRAIKSTLRRALRHRGSTLRDYRDADGKPGAFQTMHRVYDRASQPCHRCQSLIERIIVGGRSTHFCTTCQPAAVAT